jgi:translocation and assembly module TamB
VKRLALVLVAVLLLAPAWVLGTTTGLRAAAAAATRLTGGQLTIAHAEGRLLGDVTLVDFAWRSETVGVVIDRAELNLRLTRLLVGRIQAERLVVGALEITTAAGPPRPPPAEVRPLTVSMPLRLAVEEGRIDEFRLQLAGWREPWRLTDASFGAHWRDEWMVIGVLRATTAEAGPIELRGRLAIVDDLLKVEQLEAHGPATLTLNGAVALGDAASNALDVAWQQLHLPGGVAPWFSSSDGTARLEGPWKNYAWRTQAHVHLQEVAGDFVARGRGDLRSLSLHRGELSALGGVVRGAGQVGWSPQLVTELGLEWERLDPSSVWKQWPGVLNGKAQVRLTRDETLRLDFDGALRDSQLRGYPFALQATGRTADRKVVLRELALQSGASRLTARGQLLPEMALSGELTSDDLRSLWAGLSGRAELRATVAGSFAEPHVTARGVLDDVVYRGARLTRATLDADVHLAPQRTSRLELALTGLEAGALQLRSLSLTGDGTRAAHRLALAVQGRDGSARLALAGGEQGRAWRGRLIEARVQPPKGDAWALEEPAALTFSRGHFIATPMCLSSSGSRACAELRLGAADQRIAFRTRNFDLAHVRAWLPPEWNLTGALSGTASLRVAGGELRELRADLDATAGSIEGGGVRLDYGPGSLNVGPDGDRLHAQLLLRPAGGEVTGEVWIAPGPDLLDRPMLGDLRVRLPDLAWLPVLSPEIAGAQGALSADLHVSGSSRSPSLDGKVHLTGGRVQLTTPGIELTELDASFERGRNAPLLLHASAKSGDGTFTVEGEFKTLQPKLTGGLKVKGENVLGFNRPDVRAWLSPDLTLDLDGTRARLTGEIGVPKAEITPRELGRGGVSPSGDQILIERADDTVAAHGVRVETEVRIALGDDVRFDGLGLKTRLTGAITALDDAQQPTRGRGELRLEGGRYKAYGQELQIETGRLIFSGGPITDPAIDITAVRKPREDIKVGLKARGSLDAPEFSLFSEPAMAQEEQLSWLVLGRSLSATLDSNQRTQLSGAAMSLGLTGGEYLAQRLAPRLGLDEVSLGAKPGETADLARFTIGKYLSPKLFVSYGYGLFQPGHFFRMQYELGKRFKLVGESGVQQGGDLLYTIER